MSLKRGAEIAKGDVIVFLGEAHVLAAVELASSATRRIIPGAMRAVATDGWSMTIEPSNTYEVAA